MSDITRKERLAEIVKLYPPESMTSGIHNPQIVFSREGYSNFIFILSELKSAWEREKIMREALQETSVVFYEAGSKLTEDHLNRPHVFRHDFTNYKIIEEHNRRAFKGIEALSLTAELSEGERE